MVNVSTCTRDALNRINRLDDFDFVASTVTAHALRVPTELPAPPVEAKPAKQPERFLTLDSLRGLCAVAVCLFHARYNSPLLDYDVVRNAWIFVDFFFVLSGFVICASYGDRIGRTISPANFIGLRLGRIYPLHLAMLLAFLLIEVAGWFYWERGGHLARVPFDAAHSPESLITNLFMVQSIGLHDTLTWNKPAWSIATEFWSYVAFAVIVAVGGRYAERAMVAIAIAAPVLLFAVSRHGMEVTYDWGVVRSLYGFAVGVLCWRVWQNWGAAAAPSREAASFAELAMLAAVLWFAGHAGNGALGFAAPWLFGAAVLVFAAGRGIVSDLLRRPLFLVLGTLSYSIYMVHVFLQGRITAAAVGIEHYTGIQLVMPVATATGVKQYIGADAAAGTLGLFLMLVTVIGVSVLTYRYIEQPGQRWARRTFGAAPSKVR